MHPFTRLLSTIIFVAVSSPVLGSGLPQWSDDAVPGLSVEEMEQNARLHMEAEETDGEQVALWLTGAAEAGSVEAMASLAWLYTKGFGVEKDGDQAVRWYTRAVESGGSEYALHLGWIHLQEDLVEPNPSLAEKWFRRSLDAGDVAARIPLASVLIDDVRSGGDPERILEARELLDLALENEPLLASFYLARIFMEGVGVIDADAGEAYRYARVGAEIGNREMQGWLGVMYLRGVGVESDPVEALKWFNLAAAEGDELGNQLRLQMESELDAAQVSEARRRSSEWLYQQRRRQAGLADD